MEEHLRALRTQGIVKSPSKGYRLGGAYFQNSYNVVPVFPFGWEKGCSGYMQSKVSYLHVKAWQNAELLFC